MLLSPQNCWSQFCTRPPTDKKCGWFWCVRGQHPLVSLRLWQKATKQLRRLLCACALSLPSREQRCTLSQPRVLSTAFNSNSISCCLPDPNVHTETTWGCLHDLPYAPLLLDLSMHLSIPQWLHHNNICMQKESWASERAAASESTENELQCCLKSACRVTSALCSSCVCAFKVKYCIQFMLSAWH